MRPFLIWLAIVGALAALYRIIPQETREDGRRPLPPEWTRPAPAVPPPTVPPVAPADPSPPPTARNPSAGTPQPPVTGRERMPETTQQPLREQRFVLTVNSDGPREHDGLGTAFALDATGVWPTAAHVVDDCKAVYVLRGNDWRGAKAVRIHPTADVALIRAADTGPTVTLAASGTPSLGADAYHVGYPQSRPAQIHTRYIGTARIERPTRGMPPEPGHVWVEVERSPDFDGSVGGISGGPAFDAEGRIVGVTILESSRRGRLTTAPVERVRDLLLKGGVTARQGTSVATFAPDAFRAPGDSLRAAGTVAHVFCSWKGNTRPRRR
jgi:S1-C subfamily serine protease